jgi:hypothetical protein
MKQHLVAWTAKTAGNYGLSPDTSDFPPIGLAFRNQPYEEGSETSFQSYLSACSSIYSLEDETHDFPPMTDRPIPQAWGSPDPIPDLLNTTTATQSVSGISQDEFDRVTRENLKLTRQIQELTNKMQAWEQKQTAVPQLHQLDMQSIIAATTQAVLNSMTGMLAAPMQRKEETEQESTKGGANNSTEEDDIAMSVDTFPANQTDPDASFDSCLTPTPNDRP